MVLEGMLNDAWSVLHANLWRAQANATRTLGSHRWCRVGGTWVDGHSRDELAHADVGTAVPHQHSRQDAGCAVDIRLHLANDRSELLGIDGTEVAPVEEV